MSGYLWVSNQGIEDESAPLVHLGCRQTHLGLHTAYCGLFMFFCLSQYNDNRKCLASVVKLSPTIKQPCRYKMGSLSCWE